MHLIKMGRIKFIIKEMRRGRPGYVFFSIFTSPLIYTNLKNWRLKKKDEILVKHLTKKIKEEYNLNFLNVYSKFYCEALREIYENKIYDFFKVKEGDIVYDVGAGGGEYSILCSKNGAECVAFELREDAYDLMNQNINLNKFERKIKTYLGRIDDKNKLDSYLKLTKKIPSLIKIDVEGDEMKVLLGSIKIIQKHHPKIIIEAHSKELEKKCMAFLYQFKYDVKRKVLGKNSLFFLE